MSKNRMEAFSDGVLAIIITVMVLKLSTPNRVDWLAFKEMFPTLLTYFLSYVYIGIYWNNHHLLVSNIDYVSRMILWKNLNWIFWMSLIPIATDWMGLNPMAKLPVFFYGVILFMCAFSYNILQKSIIKIKGKDSLLAKRIGRDIKGKISIIAYGIAIIFSFYFILLAYLIYIIIALLWIVPDKRL